MIRAGTRRAAATSNGHWSTEVALTTPTPHSTATPAAAAQPAPPAAIADDRELARRIAAGELGAFELMMRRYNRRLFRLARASLRDDAEAEDALQEVYLRAYRSMAAFRAEAALATWLSRLVLNECAGRQRRRARRDNILPMVAADAVDDLDRFAMTPEDRSPEQELARAELRRLIEARLDALPEAFRLVFVLRELEELGVEETARALDLPEATVRSRHFRARSLLREALSLDLDLAQRDVFSFDGDRCDRIVGRVLARARDPG
jgi:RNA polymerase sigma-70 factor (ECF subfamily)